MIKEFNHFDDMAKYAKSLETDYFIERKHIKVDFYVLEKWIVTIGKIDK